MLPGNNRNLKFSALKKLHLEYFESGNYLIDLVIPNPTIESLSFECLCKTKYYFNVNKTKMVFDSLPNLKYLILGDRIKEDRRLNKH